jgi:hypothetical protein
LECTKLNIFLPPLYDIFSSSFVLPKKALKIAAADITIGKKDFGSDFSKNSVLCLLEEIFRRMFAIHKMLLNFINGLHVFSIIQFTAVLINIILFDPNQEKRC